jgi:hypothetical protein
MAGYIDPRPEFPVVHVMDSTLLLRGWGEGVGGKRQPSPDWFQSRRKE